MQILMQYNYLDKIFRRLFKNYYDLYKQKRLELMNKSQIFLIINVEILNNP